MTLSKQLTELANSSNAIRTQKRAIEIVVQTMFNNLANPTLYSLAYPLGYIRLNREFLVAHQDLTTEQRKLVSKIAGTWTSQVAESEPFTDIFSMLYDEHLGQELGQFFSPWDVSLLLGALDVALPKDLTKPYTVEEFCVGGGSLIMGKLHALYECYGPQGMSMLDIRISDIDPFLVQLASTQIVLSSIVHKIPLLKLNAVCENTLISNPKSVLFTIFNTRKYYAHCEPNQDDLEQIKLVKAEMA